MAFQNRVVLITGASSGIGEAVAREFARQGADLVLTARRKDRLDSLGEEFRKLGRRVCVVTCDVAREGDLDRAVKIAVAELGKIDIVLANAGFGVAGDLEQISQEDYRRQFETNVFGVLRTIYATLPELKKSQGVLTLLGSVAGEISLPGVSAYSMSKAAIHALAESVTPELKALGVSVVLIAPGFVVSEIRQVDNSGQYHPHAKDPMPEWVKMPTAIAARQIVRAVGNRQVRKVITIHGQLALFLHRYFSWVISGLLKLGLRGRRQPK
jgi:short-subunit dehydrogenase